MTGKKIAEPSHPAKDPPTQGKAAGENAGALPALEPAVVGGGGEGLFNILMKGRRGRRGVYGL